MRTLLFLGIVVFVACETPSLDTKPFACTADSQCGEGHFCGAGRCVPLGTELCDGTNPDAVECDVPVIIIEAGGNATHESGLQVTFSVRLSSRPNANVGLDLRVSDSTEARVAPETYLIEPATWDVPFSVTVTGLGDDEPDGSVPYQVKVSATSQDSRFNGLVGQVDLVNHDDDTPDLLVDVLSAETTESGGEAKISVRLATRPVRAVVVSATSSDTTEAEANPASLQFEPEAWFTPQLVTVVGKDDQERDGDVNYELVLTASGVPEYEGITKSIPLVSKDGVCGNGVIDGAEACDGAQANACRSAGTTPNEQRCFECACGGPAVIVTTSGEAKEGGANLKISARLRTAPEASVTLDFDLRETDEAELLGTSMTFNASNWSDPKTIEVRAINDDKADGRRPVEIDVSVATDDSQYRSVAVDSVSFSTVDNDVAGLVLEFVQGAPDFTTEVGGSTRVRARLLSEPIGDVGVTFGLPGNAPATVSPATYTFGAEDWTGIELTLQGHDNRIAGGSTTYQLTMIRNSGTAAEYFTARTATLDVGTVDGVCGNNLKEADEECDGTARQSCRDLGFRFGATTCTSDCKGVDSSGCGHGFTSVASTAGGGCAIDRAGKLKCWGPGQDLASRVTSSGVFVQVVGGVYRSDSELASMCALDSEGRVICVDSTMTTSDRFTRIALGVGSSSYKTGCGVKTDTALACWGTALSAVPPAGTGFIDVAVGSGYACAIKATGAPTCWGASASILNDQGPYVQVVARSGFYSDSRRVCGLKSDGEVRCSDRTVTGQFNAISHHGDTTYGLRSDGTVVDIDRPTTLLGASFEKLGGACGIRPNGELRCWHSDVAWPSGRRFQALYVGNNSLSLIRDGVALQARRIGSSGFRILFPHVNDVMRIVGRGHFARTTGGVFSSDGNEVLPATVGQVLSFGGGESHYTFSACWVLAGGVLQCGANIATPPLGTFKQVVGVPFQQRGFLAVTSDGGWRLWAFNSQAIPAPDPLLFGIAEVSVSQYGDSACFLYDNNTVECRIESTSHSPPTNSDFTRVVVDPDQRCFLGVRQGQLVRWGPNCSGSAPPAGSDFVDVALYSGNGYALKSDGSLVPFGNVPPPPQ